MAFSNRLWSWIAQRLTRESQLHAARPSCTRTDRKDTASEVASEEQEALAKRVASVGWYHSIDLGHSVVTPGFFDHRPILDKYQLPARLDGMRVLDAATFDGYWAFEFERRGAKEVIALDLDCFGDVDFPPKVKANMPRETLEAKIGQGFAIAHEVLGSKVRREVLSLYELSPDRLGKFDLVHSGDVLLHLMNPTKALQNLCSVTQGYALISDVYFPELDRADLEGGMQYCGGRNDCVWWKMGLETLREMILDAGFVRVELVSTFLYNSRGKAPRMHHAVFKAFPTESSAT